MTWYADDIECEFFGNEYSSSIHAIGWLDRGQPFETGVTPELVFKHLQELFQNLYSPIVSAGVHFCNLCQYLGLLS